MQKYRKKYNVILDNMDLQAYRLRPVSAIMYVQDSFARFMATKEMAAYDLFPKNIYWVVGEFNINFVDNLPFWSEEIEVEIWISELSKLKIYSDFNIYYNGEIFAQGNACWFLIDSEKKRPAPINLFSNKFDVCNELVFGEHKKFSFPKTIEKVSEIIHTINLSDIDFNCHVNNKSYINLVEMTESNEFKQNNIIKQLKVRFNRETFFGDILKCSTYKTDNENILAYKIEKDEESVCEISILWEPRPESTDILHYDLKVKTEKSSVLV